MKCNNCGFNNNENKKFCTNCGFKIDTFSLKNNDKETGCTIHLVTEEVDGGPIIIQKKCKVDSNDTIDSLKSKVQSLEGEAFLEAIPMFANNG